ncbi:MAG: hypothetical protein FJW20_04420 [Acidimicrobiia bacterium]|nr:hypothetical protein [Acidimicrobiia bacterium]
MPLLLLLALLAEPFWQTKSPDHWDGAELQAIMSDSPWARSYGGAQIYLASALPVSIAEQRTGRRKLPLRQGEIVEESEYEEFLRENPGKYIIVGVILPDPNALYDAEEVRYVEKDSVLKVGKKKHKLVGHFAPTPSDPVLRLIFPRVVDSTVKRFSLELYLPSISGPYRMFDFETKEMFFRAKLEI